MKGLKKEEYEKIRNILKEHKRPMIFFHDDPDGLCSFLLLYRHMKEGKGVVVKSQPIVDKKFVSQVERYEPDIIIIVDLALVDPEFMENVKQKIVWIDHHEPYKKEDLTSNVMYFNPRNHDKNINIPASRLCYEVAKNDMWIAMVGIIGDWFIPDIADEFREKYEELLPKNVTRPQDALFDTEIGKLARIFSFILKGTTNEALKCIKILTRINEPYEILNQTTSQGKFIYKRYMKINEEYEYLLDLALKSAGKEKLLLYTYTTDNMSFTGDLSNELLFRFPDKVILIVREKSGEMKGSLRSPPHINIRDALKEALKDVEGHGGGHENACGLGIKLRDWDKFIENLKQQIKE